MREWNRGNVWQVTRKRKGWTSLNVHAYAWPSIHYLYFIYARKIYMCTRKNYATVEINLKPVILSCESNSGTKLIPTESHSCIMQIAPKSLTVPLCTLYRRKED